MSGGFPTFLSVLSNSGILIVPSMFVLSKLQVMHLSDNLSEKERKIRKGEVEELPFHSDISMLHASVFKLFTLNFSFSEKHVFKNTLITF